MSYHTIGSTGLGTGLGTGSTDVTLVNLLPILKIEFRNITPTFFDIYYQWENDMSTTHENWDAVDPDTGAIQENISGIKTLSLTLDNIRIESISGGHSDKLFTSNNTLSYSSAGRYPVDMLPRSYNGGWIHLCSVDYKFVSAAAGNLPQLVLSNAEGTFKIDARFYNYETARGDSNAIQILVDETEWNANWAVALIAETPAVYNYPGLSGDDRWPGSYLGVRNLKAKINGDTSFISVELQVWRTSPGTTSVSAYTDGRQAGFGSPDSWQRLTPSRGAPDNAGNLTLSFDNLILDLNGTYSLMYVGLYETAGGVLSVVKAETVDTSSALEVTDRGLTRSDEAPDTPATGTLDGAALVRLEQNGDVNFVEPGVNLLDAEGDATEYFYTLLQNLDTGAVIARWIEAIEDDFPVVRALATMHNDQPVGTYRVFYMYRSTEGNTKEGELYRDIEIYAANTAPDIKINNATVYVPLGVNWDGLDSAGEKTYGGYTESDSEDSVDDLVVTIDQPGWEPNKPGEYVFTYTVTDSQGETATGERTVIVLDPPTLTTPHEILRGLYTDREVLIGGVGWWALTSRMDGRDENGDLLHPNLDQYEAFGNSKDGVNEHYGALQRSVTDNIGTASNGGVAGGTWDVVFSVTDLAGQTAESTSIFVVGTPADLSISAYASVVQSGNRMGDYKFTITLGADVDHAHILLVAASTGDRYDLMPVGTSGSSTNTYIDSDELNTDHGNFQWQVWGVDSSHNIITEVINGSFYREEVEEPDNEAPVITLFVENSPPADGDATVTLTQGTIYDESVHGGYRVTDDTDSIVEITTSPKGIPDTPGTYTITYTATDQAGNTTTVTRDVIITEAVTKTNPPTISLNGDSVVYHQSGTAYSDLGATALDSNGADITGSVQSDVAVFEGNYLSTPGTYTITYSVTDPNSGLSATVERTVTVHSVPVITLIGGSTVHVELHGTPWSEPGYTASEDGVDRYDDVVVTGTVDDSTVGTYTLTYTLTDSEDASITTSVTRTVNVMVKGCPAVEDLSLVSGAPNLSGIVVANNSLINYFGQSVDVSDYTSGQWESLSRNVGILTGHIERSAIDVGSIDIAGVATSLIDPSLWAAFPLDGSSIINLSAYVQDRSFSRGIGINQDGTNPAVEETIIKFISLTRDQQGSPQASLELFESLSASQFDYPFDWHCALDSSFSAQDVVLMASSELGIPRLSEETSYPKAFIEWRLSTMLVDGSIEPGAYQRKKYGLDGHGLIDSKGDKIPLSKLSERSPKAAEYLRVSGTKFDDNPPLKTNMAVPPRLNVPVSTSRQFWDRMHNRSTEQAPDQYITRKPKYPVMPANPTTVLKASSSTIVNGVNNHMAKNQETALYLGTMYSNEASGRNRRAVLEAIAEKASKLGLDISSYTGG